MSSLHRLIEAYEELSQTDHCPKVTYFPAGRDGIIEAARKEQAELVAALRFALPYVDMTNCYAGPLGRYHRAMAILSRFPDTAAVDEAPSTGHYQG